MVLLLTITFHLHLLNCEKGYWYGEMLVSFYGKQEQDKVDTQTLNDAREMQRTFNEGEQTEMWITDKIIYNCLSGSRLYASG